MTAEAAPVAKADSIRIGTRGLVDADWRGIRYFAKGEVARACEDGRWEMVDAGSMYALDRFAGYVTRGGHRLVAAVEFMPTTIRAGPKAGQPSAIWNTPESGAHDATSWHYALPQRNRWGQAFDLMFPRSKLATAWLTAIRYHEFGAVGAYPFWSPDPGLHCDTRPVGLEEQGPGHKVLWWKNQAGQYAYLATEQDIVEFLAVLRVAG